MGLVNRKQAEHEFERGVELFEADRIDESILAFRQAVRLDPHLDQGYIALATALGVMGKNDEAFSVLKNALKVTQDNPVILLSLGTLYNDRGEFKEAQKATEQALKLYSGMTFPMGIIPTTFTEPDPILSAMYLNLADCFYNQELYEKAELHYKKAMQANSEDLRTHINLGLTLSQMSRYDEAAEAFKTAADAHPDDPEIHNHLGIQYLMMDRMEDARDEFLRHLKLNPDDAMTCDTLGSIYHELEDDDVALEYRMLAVELDPQNVDFLIALAWSQHQVEDYEKASIAFKQAMELDPENLLVQCMYAEALALEGQSVLSKALLEKVTPLVQDNSELLIRIGRASLELGDDDNATLALHRAVALQPDNPYPHYWLGMMHLDNKQIMQARLAFDEALKLDKDNEDVYYALGLLAQETKDKAGVDEQYRTLTAMDSRLAFRLQEILERWPEE
jgi:tetratricopeptide (TPR) repeat protein